MSLSIIDIKALLTKLYYQLLLLFTTGPPYLQYLSMFFVSLGRFSAVSRTGEQGGMGDEKIKVEDT